MSALKIAKSGANLASDRKADFSQNLGCALVDFYGHYSSQDLHVAYHAMHDMHVCVRLPKARLSKRSEAEAECSLHNADVIDATVSCSPPPSPLDSVVIDSDHSPCSAFVHTHSHSTRL